MISHGKAHHPFFLSFFCLDLLIPRQIPKAGLTGNLLDERRVRKEREEATMAEDSISPPVILLGDIAEDEVDGEGGGTLRRRLGKSDKSPVVADATSGKSDKSPGDADMAADTTTYGKSDKSPGDADMNTYAGRENKKGGGRQKKKRGNKKKKNRNNNGKATRQGGPRKRFAITGGDVTGGKARKRP
jgi:hypothetical protein